MRTLKNKQGVSLLIVVMYFMVLTILLGGLFFVSMGNFRNQQTSDSHTTAYYVAESGINVTLAQFEDEIIDLMNSGVSATAFYAALDTLTVNLNGSTYTNVTTDNFSTEIGNAEANIEVSKSEIYPGVYIITSYGTVDGVTRGLRRQVLFQYALSGSGFSTDKAIVGISSITINNNASIITNADGVTSDIETYCYTYDVNGDPVLNSGFINLGTPIDFDGDIFIPSNSCAVSGNLDTPIINPEEQPKLLPIISFEVGDPSVEERALSILAQTTVPKLTTFTDSKFSVTSDGSISGTKGAVYNYTINPSTGLYGGYYVPDFVVSEATDVTFNITGDTYIVTDYLELTGHVTFEGSGKLEIYIRESTSQNIVLGYNKESYIGNIDEPEKLIIYVRDYGTNPTLSISGSTNFYGSIMFDHISIDVGNGASFNGYFMTNGDEVFFSNGSDLATGGLYYAPNALVTFKNGSYLKGSVVALNVDVKNLSTIEYVPMAAGDNPFVLMDPTNTGEPYVGEDSVYSYTFDPITEID